MDWMQFTNCVAATLMSTCRHC